ncbi:MAG TPA: hypothetical protein H9850_03590 [Candidatus Anaerobiospirillum pullistercoris]|uniref:Uncharacterized protein n=1 Tax=Candidatus Anaerobiospirillum pullistercoris TaxID=2838452 RepID=A0A9D1WCT3_9GAMM|nr:hypothetical protein [Candidatus Anaerobiospirillum pullistercoris]
MVSPIAAIGALERPHPITPELPPVPRPNPADSKSSPDASKTANAAVNPVRPVAAMQEIVQAKTAQAIQVQNTIQTAHTLMQATAAVSPRAQQEAAAKAAAAERKAQSTAAALSLSTLEHALSHGLKTNAINSAASTSTTQQTTDTMQQDAALQAQADLAQQQAQQHEQLLASIGNGSTFSQALGSVTTVSPVAMENIGALGSTPTLPSFAPAPAPLAPHLQGSHSGKGSVNSLSAPYAPLTTGTTNASPSMFDSRGNLQGQGIPDLSLLGQQQAQSVQQARALSQSLALSISGQLQPSLLLQLGLGAKLFELLMQSHRRMGSLSILQEARSNPEQQAIDGDEALQAIQSTNQILVAVYLEHMFSLIAAVRRQMAQKRGKKQGQAGDEDTGDSGDSEGEELNELSAELDYIKQARKHTSNQDFHASMLIPRH